MSPRAAREAGGSGVAVAEALAGDDGSVVFATEIGVRTLSRSLSAAEVALLRGVLAGAGPIVGYACRGAALRGPALVAVGDHVNLTWRSPLTGPNDDGIGPRFPSMTGIYAPRPVVDRVKAAGGMIVEVGVVVGVRDDSRLTSYEAGVVSAPEYLAVSEELVPVVIVAAHMGLQVAAVVVTDGPKEEETSSGRS